MYTIATVNVLWLNIVKRVKDQASGGIGLLKRHRCLHS